MRFVSVLLTDEQAELAAAALRDAESALREELTDEEHTGEQAANNERVAEDARFAGRLSMLFQDAAENPTKYAPTGKMAATVRGIVRRAKGPAQPPRKNKRKARQEARMRTSKERRKFRRQIAENYNKARTIMEAEKAEMEQIHAETMARIEAQPKYKVVNAFGQSIIEGVPAEFVVRMDGEGLPASEPVETPTTLLLPASHEKAHERGEG